MTGLLRAVFGAHGQLAVGALMVATTALQAWWWGIHSHPGAAAIFWLSIEALFYGAYNVFCTALGYRAAERIEEKIETTIVADDVDVQVNT